MPSRYAVSDPLELDVNSMGATTAAFTPLQGATKMTFYCVSRTGTHATTEVTPQVSPDGTNWFDVTASRISAARGQVSDHECICHSVRFKVTIAEGSPAICDLYVFSV